MNAGRIGFWSSARHTSWFSIWSVGWETTTATVPSGRSFATDAGRITAVEGSRLSRGASLEVVGERDGELLYKVIT